MGGEYYRLTPHQQRTRCAVQHEREGYYHRAANAWRSVARLAPNHAWQQWALLLKLMALGLKEQLLQDIQVRKIALSNKVARRCLQAISHSSEYLSLMVAGIPRYGLNGEVQGSVTKDEQAYALEKMSAVWQRRVAASLSTPTGKPA